MILSSRLTLFLSLALSSVAAVILSIIDHRIAGPLGDGIMAFQFSFTKERTLQILYQWGPAGISLYQKTVWLDFIFPIALALLSNSLLARKMMARGRMAGDDFFLMLPWVAVVMDYTENALQIVLSHDTATHPDVLFTLMSLCATAKYISFLLPLIGIMRQRRRSGSAS